MESATEQLLFPAMAICGRREVHLHLPKLVWLLPHSSTALPTSGHWVGAALGPHSFSTSGTRQESFCELRHIIALQQAKRNVLSESGKRWELRISSSGSPPVPCSEPPGEEARLQGKLRHKTCCSDL